MSKRLLQKITDKGFCLRQCPATCGIPTKTTAAGWARTCHATYRDETGPLPCGSPRLVKSYCEQCGMATIPPEVEIATPAAMLPPGHKIVAAPPVRRNRRKIDAVRNMTGFKRQQGDAR